MATLKAKIIFGSTVTPTNIDMSLALTSEDSTIDYTASLDDNNVDSSDSWTASASGWATISNITWAASEEDPDNPDQTIYNPIAYSAQSAISSIIGITNATVDVSISIARDISTNEWEEASSPYGFSFSSDTETKYLKIIVTITQSEVTPTQREIEGINLNVTIYPPVFRPQNINTIVSKDRWLKYQKMFLQGIKTEEGNSIAEVRSSLSYTIRKTSGNPKTHNLYYENKNTINNFFTILSNNSNNIYDTIFNNETNPVRGLNLQIPLFGDSYQVAQDGTITVPTGTGDTYLKSEEEHYVYLTFNYGYYDNDEYVAANSSQVIINTDVTNKYVSINSIENRILPNVPIMQLKKRGVRFNTPAWASADQTADVMINHSNLNSDGDSLALYDYRTITVNNEDSISNKPSLAFYGYDPSLITDETVNYNPHRWSTKLTSYYWTKYQSTFLLENRGTIIIGSGESGTNYFNYLSKETNKDNLIKKEWLALTADSSVYIMTNMQDIGSLNTYSTLEPSGAKVWRFDANGEIYTPAGNQVVTTSLNGTYGRIWTSSSERVGITVTGSNKIRYDGIFGPSSIILKNNTTNTKIWESFPFTTALRSKLNSIGNNRAIGNSDISNANVSTGSFTKLGQFTLSEGYYLLCVTVTFPANTNGTYRSIGVSTATPSTMTDIATTNKTYVAPVTSSSVRTYVQVICFLNLDSSTAVKVYAQQDSGSTLSSVATRYSYFKLL